MSNHILNAISSRTDYLLKSKQRHHVDISQIKTVCLLLGPYRNLTTLTASILALHPHCQVLNHAGERIFANPKVNFLANYSDKTFEHFCRYATAISAGGKRGDYGGSITLSHAFANHKRIKDRYEQRFGDSRLKENIHCLFWKESMRTSNMIRKKQVDLKSVFQQNEKIRFLMPIRNPLDCAISNMKNVHSKHFQFNNPTTENVLDAIIQEIAWFIELKSAYPDRFFYFMQHHFDEFTLKNLLEFLDLEPDQEWLDDAVAAYQLKQPYEYSTTLVKQFHMSLGKHLQNFPEIQKALLSFVSSYDESYE